MVQISKARIPWDEFKAVSPCRMWRRGNSVVLASQVILLVADDLYADVGEGYDPLSQFRKSVENAISLLSSVDTPQPLPKTWDTEWWDDLKEFAVRVKSVWFQTELMKLVYMLPRPVVYGLAQMAGSDALVAKGADGSLLCIASLSRKY